MNLAARRSYLRSCSRETYRPERTDGQRARTVTVILGVAAAFYLLNVLIQVPILRVMHTVGVDRGVSASILFPAVYAISEEACRYLSFRAGHTMRENRTSTGAVLAGLGHGCMEALVLLVLFAMHTNSWSWLGFGLFAAGRILAVCTHLGLATLVVLAYRRSRWCLVLAVLAHFAVDWSTFALQARAGLWYLLLFTIWAFMAFALILLVKRRGPLASDATQKIGTTTGVTA